MKSLIKSIVTAGLPETSMTITPGGMSANLCVEAHMREMIERGFEVAVVKDATAGAKAPEGVTYMY